MNPIMCYRSIWIWSAMLSWIQFQLIEFEDSPCLHDLILSWTGFSCGLSSDIMEGSNWALSLMQNGDVLQEVWTPKGKASSPPFMRCFKAAYGFLAIIDIFTLLFSLSGLLPLPFVLSFSFLKGKPISISTDTKLSGKIKREKLICMHEHKRTS